MNIFSKNDVMYRLSKQTINDFEYISSILLGGWGDLQMENNITKVFIAIWVDITF